MRESLGFLFPLVPVLERAFRPNEDIISLRRVMAGSSGGFLHSDTECPRPPQLKQMILGSCCQGEDVDNAKVLSWFTVSDLAVHSPRPRRSMYFPSMSVSNASRL